MTKQITLEELLEVITVKQTSEGFWQITDVKCTIFGDVGDVFGDVGDVSGSVGDVFGDVCGDVYGIVRGKINGKEWQFIETPKDKLKRLIEEGADKEQLLEAFNQLENN